MKLIQIPFAIILSTLLLVCSSTLAVAENSQSETVEAITTSVNLNNASVEELAEKLEGVGQARAELIVKYREQHGPFTSVEQLLEIKGIGAATLEKNRAKILL